ncbi:hypothetical protein [Desulforegula conservatrix]|uniref:hypothetical protein n=1 Tax=Desulforegula conservatrix TaxID=153026 RepID=UPI000684A5E1|nr:hypothetical protein [Desulforegula conservatrix]
MQSYRSLHPNHVHQLTVSVSKHYWVTKDGTIKFQSKAIEMNLDKLSDSNKNHLIHYVIRDHFSGVVYSEIATSASIIPVEQFLFRAWSQKDGFVFCGIPDLLTIPKTVEKKFPQIKEKVSLLGVQFPQVTSGFQSGVRDVKTLEEYMKFYIEMSFKDVFERINKTYVFPSTMDARVGKQTKLEFWRKHIESVKLPPEVWLNI